MADNSRLSDGETNVCNLAKHHVIANHLEILLNITVNN